MDSLFVFLTVVQAFIAAGLVILVLMQRSEGGGLGVGGGGGGPGGMLSARGAADFLTRATKWFAVAFVSLSIVLAAVAVGASGNRDFEATLDRTTTEPAEGADPLAIPGAAGGEAAAPAEGAAEAAAPVAEVGEADLAE